MPKQSFAFVLTLVITLFLLNTAFAAPKKHPMAWRTDSSKIEPRHFNNQALNKLKADKEFNYNGPATGEPTFWDIFWQWLYGFIARIFEKVPYGGTIFKYLLIGASVAFLIYVILKSLGLDAVQLMRGESRRVELPYSESLEDIHEIDFDSEIEKAIAQHNYRLAVRLLYLKYLKQLSDSQLIHWQINKTNSAYFYEITDPEQKKLFGVLTRQFEYVWYGNFLIDKQAFSNINALFQNFKKQLK